MKPNIHVTTDDNGILFRNYNHVLKIMEHFFFASVVGLRSLEKPHGFCIRRLVSEGDFHAGLKKTPGYVEVTYGAACLVNTGKQVQPELRAQDFEPELCNPHAACLVDWDLPRSNADFNQTNRIISRKSCALRFFLVNNGLFQTLLTTKTRGEKTGKFSNEVPELLNY